MGLWAKVNTPAGRHILLTSLANVPWNAYSYAHFTQRDFVSHIIRNFFGGNIQLVAKFREIQILFQLFQFDPLKFMLSFLFVRNMSIESSSSRRFLYRYQISLPEKAYPKLLVWRHSCPNVDLKQPSSSYLTGHIATCSCRQSFIVWLRWSSEEH